MVEYIYRLECDAEDMGNFVQPIKRQWPTYPVYYDGSRGLVIDFPNGAERDAGAKFLMRHFQINNTVARNVARRICLNCAFCEAAQCRRYPEPIAVGMDHWCGEFKFPDTLRLR